jgi:hypothetical protein
VHLKGNVNAMQFCEFRFLFPIRNNDFAPCVLVSSLIWYPFFKVYEKQEVANETNEKTNGLNKVENKIKAAK